MRMRLSALDSPSAQMRETIGEERPARHLGQQIGDADTWQRGVKTRGQRFGFRRRRFLIGEIFSTPCR